VAWEIAINRQDACFTDEMVAPYFNAFPAYLKFGGLGDGGVFLVLNLNSKFKIQNSKLYPPFS
jgi:hypothetical protein